MEEELLHASALAATARGGRRRQEGETEKVILLLLCRRDLATALQKVEAVSLLSRTLLLLLHLFPTPRGHTRALCLGCLLRAFPRGGDRAPGLDRPLRGDLNRQYWFGPRFGSSKMNLTPLFLGRPVGRFSGARVVALSSLPRPFTSNP